MIRRYLTQACRAILGLARAFTGAVESGAMPHQMSSQSTQENIAWGHQWIAGAVVSVLTGETISISRIDLIMLALFFASIIVTRHGLHRPVIVYQAIHAT